MSDVVVEFHQVNVINIPATSSYTILKWVVITGALYFGVGTLFNMKKLGKQGTEAIPNIEFWQELPLLVVSGINYTVHSLLGYSR